MLILTRKIGESIVIGDSEITITVLADNRGQTRLGITAPKHLSVHRQEVFERIQEENTRSSKRVGIGH